MLKPDRQQGHGRQRWHTDVTFVDRIPAISILRGVTIPPYGGTTVWANTVTAYDVLPAPLKALVDELWAVHTNELRLRRASATASRRARRPDFSREEFARSSSRPSTRSCACTPRPASASLVLGHFVKTFIGLNTAESDALFNLLQNRVTKLENTIRWTWAEGDVAIWDNRATQHYAVADFGTSAARCARITVAGDVPVEHRRSPQRGPPG